MIILTGGGTGGHLNIVRALGEELKKDNKLIYVGSMYGQDMKWFKDSDIFEKKYFMHIKGFANKPILSKISFLIMLLYSMMKLVFVFYRYKIDKVVGVGGYSSAPSCFLAILLRKKLFIHEQNYEDGGLNKLLSNYSNEYFNTFKTNHSYPVSKDFFDKSRLRENINTILFLGGSLGANAINEFAIKIADKLNQKNISIIHQCGISDYEKVKFFYESNNIKARVYSFSNDISTLMNEADFCISRAGASTLFELVANGLPTLFIPYPFASYNHQYKNALHFHKDNLCLLKKEDEIKNINDISIILDTDIKTMSKSLLEKSKSDGAKTISNIISNYKI